MQRDSGIRGFTSAPHTMILINFVVAILNVRTVLSPNQTCFDPDLLWKINQMKKEISVQQCPKGVSSTAIRVFFTIDPGKRFNVM
jgi:hypothetical protein